MKKHLCDLCEHELVELPNKGIGIESGILALFSSVSVFRVKAVYKITKFTLQIPFISEHKDLDMCSKCMDDFKEFVQRKTAYHRG